MYVPIHGDGMISQFEGYERLAELDWEGYRDRYGDIRRLDRILEAEGDSRQPVQGVQAGRRPDAVLPALGRRAAELFDRLGYRLAPDRSHDRRVLPGPHSHGSTLSAVVHAWVLARNHREQALEYFVEALDSDIADVQGGTTAEGIHLAAMAGSVDLLQRCFAGVETRDDTLWLNPYWPPGLGTLEFVLCYREHWLTLRITGSGVRVSADAGTQRPILLRCRGEAAVLRPGAVVDFATSPDEFGPVGKELHPARSQSA